MFMGDTGSLAIGGALAAVAILIKQELVLILIGGVFVLEALSVVVQVGGFKLSRRVTGTGRGASFVAHHCITTLSMSRAIEYRMSERGTHPLLRRPLPGGEQGRVSQIPLHGRGA